MKAIITADIHNGCPNHLDDSIWSMQVIREYAHKNDIGTIFVLGDLFHDRVNINIEVLSRVYDFFDETDKKYDQRWICFPGNHDMFLKNSWGINSLRPFNRLLDIYEDISLIEVDGSRFWIIPFIHYESAYMEVMSKVNEKCNKDDILLTHIGVHGAKLNVCFLLQNWSVVNLSNTKFKKVYAGHFHCHQDAGKVVYPGSPIPFRFDEGFVEHGFLVIDTDKNEDTFIPIMEVGPDLIGKDLPPDYITVLDNDIGTFNDANGNNIKIILNREYTKNEIQELQDNLTAKGARNVVIQKMKEEEKNIVVQAENIKVKSIDEIFKSWIEHDKPDLNKQLLIKINDQVCQEAKELIIVEDVEVE